MRSSKLVNTFYLLFRFAAYGVCAVALRADDRGHLSYHNATLHFQGNSTDGHQDIYYHNATAQVNYASAQSRNQTVTSTIGHQATPNNTLPPSHAKSQSPSSVASPISKGVNSTGYTIRTSSSKSSEPPTKTIAVEEVTKTSPEEARRRVKKVISPSFFYKQGRARVKCASPKVVYNIDPHENVVGFPLDKWPHWRVLFPHPPDGWAEIEHFQLDCSRHCKCNEHGGVELRPKLGGCSSKFKADKCAVALGCYCTAVLVQPTANIPGATLADFQDAIDRIPETIRNDNPYYWWEMHGLAVPRRPWDLMGWSREQAPPRPVDLEPPWMANNPGRISESEVPLSGPNRVPPPGNSNILWRGGKDVRGGKPQKREALKDEDSVKENPKRTLPSEEDDTKSEVLKRRDSDNGQSGIGGNVVDGAEDSHRGN
ncbi:hypothetical protein AOL_s00188g283 [Orbilia oligospora ATCC 24927]|uniref:Uncharacterized protein n=1 Tax=Arthrobotrys oligospora (strain ATCC 24927 / CBS 115.81 / DSM 1491) TaxID=756982 RepID=G1XQS1_ARTOA|nr:hypothetical protein AOL_s00188g283 [Orbilia oligospora ATCC 24927]EGX44615.1 hypothetical protein AOL_s00188g283 [Orbilia oligospora ATCC 24927]